MEHNSIKRPPRAASGKEHLNIIRRSLIGKTIADMGFENNTQNVKTLLFLENGSRFNFVMPCHDVDMLRELFGDEIEREKTGSLSGER